jgi:hypothetical protein
MQASSLVTCFWPGLPQLWWRGDWRALLVAIGFATAVNLALVSSFLWPEMLSSPLLGIGWAAILAFWAICAWHGRRCLPMLRGVRSRREREDLFVRAQTEYLKGHWFEAETLLGQLLEEQDSDVDAQLMLATLYRRTRRIEDGQRKLKVLERMDGAEKWALEMAREREMLDRLE